MFPFLRLECGLCLMQALAFDNMLGGEIFEA